MGNQDNASETTTHEVQSEKHWRSGKVGKRLDNSSNTTCAVPRAPRLSAIAAIPEGFRSLGEREDEFKNKLRNERKIAAIGAPVRNDGRADLRDV